MYWPILLYALIPFFILMLLIITFYVALATMQIRVAARLTRRARDDEAAERDAEERLDDQ